jgi:hypothetical protein
MQGRTIVTTFSIIPMVTSEVLYMIMPNEGKAHFSTHLELAYWPTGPGSSEKTAPHIIKVRKRFLATW